MDRALAPHGLVLGQLALLMAVLEREGQTQTDLGGLFSMPAWKISRYLDSLAAAGLLERRADACSRRTHRIHPTEAARRLAPQLRAAAEAVNATMLAPLSDDQRRAFIAALQAVVLPGERW